MPPVSTSPDERSRKATSLVLQRLSPDGTARNLAQVFGVSESTISRHKEAVEPVMRLVTHLGLKVVDADRTCVSASEIAVLRRAYAKVIEQAPWLLDEGDQ